MPGVRTSLVRIVGWRKEEFLDRHKSSSHSGASRRQFLLLLSPDTLQLVTAADASGSDAPAGGNGGGGPLTASASIKGPTPRMSSLKPLLHRLATSGGSGAAAAAAAAAAGGSEGGEEGSSRGEGPVLGEEPLEEGQLLTFSIALSQVSSLECSERRIKILFCRQKPHRSTASNDDWKSVAKGVFFPLAYPYEAAKHGWGVQAFMSRHRRDPFVSSVTLETESPQEATALHAAIEAAISRLSQAVQWLSQDLPLDSRPVVTLVTQRGSGSGSGSGAAGAELLGSGLGGGAASSGSRGSTAAEKIVCAFPGFKQPLDVAIPAEMAGSIIAATSAAPAGSPGGKLGKQRDGDDGSDGDGDGETDSEDEDGFAVNVWLHSPLGPAVARITTAQLCRSADAGGAPVTVVGKPHEEAAARQGAAAAAAATGSSGRDRLEVLLQFSATRHHAPLPAALSWQRSSPVRGTPARAVSGLSGGGASGGRSSSVGTSSSSSSTLPAILAVLCMPLAALLQLLVTSSTPTADILHSVSFLATALAAVVAIVVLQLKADSSRGLPAAVAAAAAEAAEVAPQQAGCFRLLLLHADLVRESRHEGGAPTVQRVLSSAVLPSLSAAPSAPAPALPLDEEGAVELPPAIRRLVAQHPDVLSGDVAARFLVGLGHADKAYQAIKNMVDWVEAQGVQDLVRQPQPRFEAIKAHYPQVFYCWSSRADCLVEVECTGRWRAAFDALKALGVTDTELLRHQFFCMEYAFKVLDTRPLPQGKTVKIIDLEGLSLRDVSSAAFKWYLQVGGALLAVNYPQRLHKAFLLNAPPWSGVIWKVLAAFVPRRVRDQLMLFTKKEREAAAEALLQWVPAEQLPVQYGGKCTVPLSQSQPELEMLAYVRQLNKTAEAAGAATAGAAPPGSRPGPGPTQVAKAASESAAEADGGAPPAVSSS